MLGIIVSLFAALAALSFAFNSDDKKRNADSEWRGLTHRISKQLPVCIGKSDTKDNPPSQGPWDSVS